MYICTGFLTTSTALHSLFLILLHHPEVEEKLSEEINSVIGSDRFPTLSDRQNMPYTEATMLELLRYITHTPIGAPHKTTQDVEINGYKIPKGTPVRNMHTHGNNSRVNNVFLRVSP